MKAIPLLIVTLSQLALATTWSAVVTYQEGGSNAFVTNYAGTSDTFLASNVSDTNYGGEQFLLVGRNEQRFTILRFDLSSLTGEYESITSASLTLTRTGTATALDFDINIYSILSTNGGWDEMEATWVNQDKSSSTPWQNAAGEDQGNFMGARGELLQTISYTTTTDSITVNIPISMVLEWITNPAAAGGLALIPSGSSGSSTYSAYLGSSEVATASSRPLLTVNYAPIPEPSSILMSMGGLGFLVLVYRKRLRV